jgi:O-antigen/teichoic acid export membrane protein
MIKVLFTIGAIQVLQMTVLLARTKGLALLLGPEQVGLLAVIDKLVAVFVQTASLSLPFAALRFLPSLWISNPPEFYRR